MAHGIDDKLDESLGMVDGPEDTKDQSMEDRRDESLGEDQSVEGGDIDALISHLEQGLIALKEYKASMEGGGELIEGIGLAEELPGGDILEEGAAVAEAAPEDIGALLEAEMAGPPPEEEEEEEAFDLEALTTQAAKNALA